jgi:hypothetical protein
MKGPFERLKYDLRRIWECPACGAKQRTDGAVTTRFCQCGKPNTNPLVAMKLVSDGPRRTVPPIAPPVPEIAVPVSVAPNDVVSTTGTADVTQLEVMRVEVTQVEVIAVAPPEIVAGPVVDVISPVDPAGPSP